MLYLMWCVCNWCWGIIFLPDLNHCLLVVIMLHISGLLPISPSTSYFLSAFLSPDHFVLTSRSFSAGVPRGFLSETLTFSCYIFSEKYHQSTCLHDHVSTDSSKPAISNPALPLEFQICTVKLCLETWISHSAVKPSWYSILYTCFSYLPSLGDKQLSFVPVHQDSKPEFWVSAMPSLSPSLPKPKQSQALLTPSPVILCLSSPLSHSYDPHSCPPAITSSESQPQSTSWTPRLMPWSPSKSFSPVGTVMTLQIRSCRKPFQSSSLLSGQRTSS